MHTLFDFITHIKIVEYIISVSAIAVYMLFWEALKPMPFKTLVTTGKEDIEFLRSSGSENMYKSIGRIVSAPFIGLAYIVALPFGFIFALGQAALQGLSVLTGKEASFGWRPSESYLAGKEGDVKKKDEKD